MLRLPYSAEEFPTYLQPSFPSPQEMHFSWEELCRAAITVGRRSWADVLQHGTYSILEIMWRAAIIRANLVEDASGNGRLNASQAFIALDPSEKSGISYFLGLTLTKLVAEKLFGVPWLLHLDAYKSILNPHLALPQRPDFVGMDASYSWLVVESKGRSRQITGTLMEIAKIQTRSLRNINGALPSMRIAVGTYFSRGALRARLRDPEGYNDNAQDLDINPEQFARAYYKPIVEAIDTLRQGGVVDSAPDAEEANILGLDMRLRLDPEVYDWYHGGGTSWDAIVERRRAEHSLLSEVRRMHDGDEAEEEFLAFRRLELAAGEDRLKDIQARGRDGFEVVLGDSWRPQLMRLQPPDRGGGT